MNKTSFLHNLTKVLIDTIVWGYEVTLFLSYFLFLKMCSGKLVLLLFLLWPSETLPSSCRYSSPPQACLAHMVEGFGLITQREKWLTLNSMASWDSCVRARAGLFFGIRLSVWGWRCRGRFTHGNYRNRVHWLLQKIFSPGLVVTKVLNLGSGRWVKNSVLVRGLWRNHPDRMFFCWILSGRVGS